MKNLLLLALLCFPFSLFAQEGWTSVSIEADSSGKDFEILDTIYVPLYPDSNILNGKTEYKGCPIDKQHNIHGIGQSLDFKEHKWVSVEFDEWAPSIEIDSILFNYHYHRNSSANTVDTLIVQLSNIEYDKDGSASVPTRRSGLSKEHVQTIEIPLTEADSTLYNNRAKFYAFALNEPIWRQNIAVTFFFKNGASNDSFVAKNPLNSANIFSLASYALKKSKKPPLRFNNGLLLTTDDKYLDSAYSRSYLELHGDTVELYPAIYFKYTNYEIGFYEKEAHAVSVFPTLLKSGKSIHINAKSPVMASIFDFNGQLLQSSATNQISTTGLAKGIYLLKLDTQTFFTTQRIVVY